jgi:hypothetical protein
MSEIDKNRIDDFIIDGFNSYMRNRENRRLGIHITSIARGCSRYIYLENTQGIDEFDMGSDLESIKAVVGTMMHNIPLSEEHETHFEYPYKFGKTTYRILGSYDELYTDENGNKWIMDKKFTPFIKKNPPDVYVKQVKLYAMLYNKGAFEDTSEHKKDKVEGAIISYINTGYGKEKFNHFVIPISEKDYKEIEEWFESIVKPAFDAFITQEIPDRTEGWSCTICPFINTCYTQEEKVNILKKYKRKKDKVEVEIVGIDKLKL